MAGTAAIISAVAAVAGAGSGIAGQMGLFGGGDGGGGGQAPAPMPGSSGMDFKRAAIPGAKADAAANVGGGISPEFLAGLVSQQSGIPGGGMDVIEDIRKSLGV